MNFKKIVIAGGGVLGSQIAYQTAFKGCEVTMWLRSEGSIDRAKPKIAGLHKIYLQTLDSFKGEGKKSSVKFGGLVENPDKLDDEIISKLKKDADDAYNNIKYITDMEEAVKDADLVIESIAEDPKMKVEFYTKLAKILPEKTILATNSSTMLPSHFAEYTGRPEKYIALHFLNKIWENNIAEIMGHPGTSEDTKAMVTDFAKQISMVPLPLNKEQPGYIFNSMLVPFLSSAEALWVNGVAEPKVIDQTWVKVTGSKYGPFQILDMVGLTTACNIAKMTPGANDPNSVLAKIIAKLQGLIDEGKTGLTAGEGFYKYN